MIMFSSRRRARIDDSDGGFVLMYVMLISLIVMVGITTVVATTSAGLTTARTSQNKQSATAAAQAGVQDALSYFKATPSSTCATTASVADTTPCATGTDARTGVFPTGSGQAFSWSAYRIGNATVRVKSTGTAGSTNQLITADFSISSSAGLAYEYFSAYEALNPSAAASLGAAHTVAIDCNSIRNSFTNSGGTWKSGSCPSTATWNAATGTDNCGKLWYDSSSYDGASSSGRSNTFGASNAGNYSEWSQATSTPSGVTTTGSCEVPFTQGMSFDGPVYTMDAPLISNGSGNGRGPSFGGTFNTGWSSSANPAPGATLYRTDPTVGGTVTANAPTYATAPSALATEFTQSTPAFSPSVPASACIFYGPTRVLLNGDGTATVTSPLTSASNSAETLSSDSTCYSSPTSVTGQWTVNYGSAGGHVIYVKNLGSANNYQPTGQKSPIAASSSSSPPSNAAASSSVFYVSGASTSSTVGPDQGGTAVASDSGCGTTAYDPNSASPNQTCAWSEVHTTNGVPDQPGWTLHTSDSTNGCGVGRTANDQHNFDCETNGNQTSGSTVNTLYGTLRDSKLMNNGSFLGQCGSRTSNGQQTYLVSDIETCVESNIKQMDNNATSFQYVATPTVLGTTTGTTQAVSGTCSTTGTGPLNSDSLFSNQSGGTPVETQTKQVVRYDVFRQVKSGSNWVTPGTPQFSFTVTLTTWPVTCPGAVSYFPNVYDVTQYRTGSGGANGSDGPGDVYVEGTNKGPLALLADGDEWVTGPITTASGSTNATVLDALGSVQVYHPVACAVAAGSNGQTLMSSTSAGWCPNDVTGLYTGSLQSNGTLKAPHQSLQYCNMTTGQSGNNGNQNCNQISLTTGTSWGSSLEIDASLVAQGGSFGLSNYNRGLTMNDVNVYGGIFERYHGPFEQEWDVQSGQNTRAYAGSHLSLHYADMQNKVSYIPTAASVGSTTWKLISVSSGGS